MALEIFKLFGTIMVNSDDANKNIKKTSDNAEGFGHKLISGIGTVAKWGAGVVAAAGAATTAMYAFTESAASTLDNIDKSSQKMGLSSEAYQTWDYILEHCGASISTLQTSVKKITNYMQDAIDPTSSAAENFKKIGVSVTDSNGNLRDAESVFSDVITGLQNMDNEAERNALANDLLGGSYTELIPLKTPIKMYRLI